MFGAPNGALIGGLSQGGDLGESGNSPRQVGVRLDPSL